nr:unnamed protein product [Callosobruchus chinensis]
MCGAGVRLYNRKTLQDVLVKALEVEAVIIAMRMTTTMHRVEQDDEVDVNATSFTTRRRILPVCTTLEGTQKFTCWTCGQKGHLRVGRHIQVNEMKVNVEKAAHKKMKCMPNKINSVKEQLKRDTENLLKKNEETQDVDNKVEERLTNLENENGRPKKELEKALVEAQAGSSGKKQLKDKSNKMKQNFTPPGKRDQQSKEETE